MELNKNKMSIKSQEAVDGVSDDKEMLFRVWFDKKFEGDEKNPDFKKDVDAYCQSVFHYFELLMVKISSEMFIHSETKRLWWVVLLNKKQLEALKVHDEIFEFEFGSVYEPNVGGCSGGCAGCSNSCEPSDDSTGMGGGTGTGCEPEPEGCDGNCDDCDGCCDDCDGSCNDEPEEEPEPESEPEKSGCDGSCDDCDGSCNDEPEEEPGEKPDEPEEEPGDDGCVDDCGCGGNCGDACTCKDK